MPVPMLYAESDMGLGKLLLKVGTRPVYKPLTPPFLCLSFSFCTFGVACNGAITVSMLKGENGMGHGTQEAAAQGG
jgi:hypothetical protein